MSLIYKVLPENKRTMGVSMHSLVRRIPMALGPLVWLPGWTIGLVLVAASFYIPVYLYKAMRRVYGQGHLMTLMKYVVLIVAYSAGATFTMLGATLFALVSL